jgi:hypothetical protein
MITFAEILPLYLTGVAIALPLIALNMWRRTPILRLNLRNGR